jgi:membrane-bound lytic murein transglycosylase D
VNGETDDRLDVQKSTRAAARYLKDLYAQFDEWPLALAAYNAGEQLVRDAVLRGGAKDFVRLRNKGLLPVFRWHSTESAK